MKLESWINTSALWIYLISINSKTKKVSYFVFLHILQYLCRVFLSIEWKNAPSAHLWPRHEPLGFINGVALQTRGAAASSCLRARVSISSQFHYKGGVVVSGSRTLWTSPVWAIRIFRRLIFMRLRCKFRPFHLRVSSRAAAFISALTPLCAADKYWWNASAWRLCVSGARSRKKQQEEFLWGEIYLFYRRRRWWCCVTRQHYTRRCGVSSINIYRRPPRKAQSTLWLIKRMRKRERKGGEAPSSKIFKAKQISSRAYSITRAKTSVCK